MHKNNCSFLPKHTKLNEALVTYAQSKCTFLCCVSPTLDDSGVAHMPASRTYKFQSSLKKAPEMKERRSARFEVRQNIYSSFSLLSYFRPEKFNIKLRNKEVFVRAKRRGEPLRDEILCRQRHGRTLL